MKLEPISKVDVLAAPRRNGTRDGKIAEVEAILQDSPRCYQDDDLTIIVSGDNLGKAERHGRDSETVKTLAMAALEIENSGDLNEYWEGYLREEAETVLSRMGTDAPDADRGMSIAACRLLA